MAEMNEKFWLQTLEVRDKDLRVDGRIILSCIKRACYGVVDLCDSGQDPIA